MSAETPELPPGYIPPPPELNDGESHLYQPASPVGMDPIGDVWRELQNPPSDAQHSAEPSHFPDIQIPSEPWRQSEAFKFFGERLGQLNEQDREIVVTWYPHVFGKHSEFLGGYIGTLEALIMHVRAYNRAHHNELQSNAAAQRKESARTAWDQWQQACRERKNRIELARQQVNVAREQARAAKEANRKLLEQQMAQIEAEWDDYIDKKRIELSNAKAEPVPPRPA